MLRYIVWFFFFVLLCFLSYVFFLFFQAEDGIRDYKVTGVQTCALPISRASSGSCCGWRLPSPRSPPAGKCWSCRPEPAWPTTSEHLSAVAWLARQRQSETFLALRTCWTASSSRAVGSRPEVTAETIAAITSFMVTSGSAVLNSTISAPASI